MKTINGWIVILALGPFGSMAAQENEPVRVGGRVLLLQSDRGLEGVIEKIGDQYRIRRGSGEVWLPVEKGSRLCADWDEAYALLKTRANLGDPEERLRLARWCQQNNLRSQALEEAKEAFKMRPMHEETRQLVAVLTRSVAALQNAPAGPARPNKIAAALPPSDISADTFALFATRVQPILMNTCVNCHSGERGGDFQLIRTEGGQRGSTQANLNAVLAQVKVDNPMLSPLLVKAVSRHGNAAQAPIKDRKSVPFQTLLGWIDYLLVNNPHLREGERRGVSPPVVQSGERRNVPTPVMEAGERRGVNPPVAGLPTGFGARQPLEVAPTTFGSNRPADEESALNVLDSFDPAVFNRQMHVRK